MAHHLVPRQTGVYSYSGCTSFDYTAVDNCYYSSVYSAYPTCYNYYSDANCCTAWLNWEEGYFSCLQTAYSNCFDFTSYINSVSDFLPCYTNAPFNAPQSNAAQTTIATTPVPALSLEAISTGPPTAAQTHSAIPTYSGQGSLLQGYCATPDYVLLDGPTALWAPAVGCVGDKSDCCPYSVRPATATTIVYVVSTVTVNVDPSGSTLGDYAGLAAYPTPASSNQATLAHCPGDYVSISGRCCPSGYKLWNANLGGQVPCYSSLDSNSYLVPPAVPVTDYGQQVPVTGNVTGAAPSSSTPLTPQKPTSAVVNIVYAVPFPVLPSPGLSTGAKAGIGVGAGLGGVAIIVLSLLLIWRTRKHKKDKQALAAMQQTAGQGQVPNGQNQLQNGMSEATSPYAYSQRTELQTDGNPQMVQTPGGFVPQEQNGYFQQQQMMQPPQSYGQPPGQQMQQGLAPQGHYAQQPGQQMQGQSPVQYPSPVASTVSPQPTGSDGYGHQTGYAGTVPSSTGSPPPQVSYEHQTGYAAPATELSPNSTGYGAPNSATYISPNTTGSPAVGEGYGYQGGYNQPGSHPQPQELNAQTGYAAPANEVHHPQELNAQPPPGEMHG